MSEQQQTVLPPEPWYHSAVQRSAVLGIVSGMIAVLIDLFGLPLDVQVANAKIALFGQLVSLGFNAWAIIKRQTSAVQPLTLTASAAAAKAAATNSVLPNDPTKQSGFVRPLMLAVLMALSTVAMSVSVTGCTHTQQAIRNAETPSDYALVFLEGYDGALKTANQLKESGALSGENLLRVQQAELKAWPLVQKIDPLRQAYERTRSAEDAAALQLAIDAAIREAADFIRIVRELRG